MVIDLKRAIKKIERESEESPALVFYSLKPGEVHLNWKVLKLTDWSFDNLDVKIQMSFFQGNSSLEVMILEDEWIYPTSLHSVYLAFNL